MPQMMPLSWMILFIVFSTSLILFAVMTYYSFIPPTKSASIKIKLNSTPWKW
uniref:ATP synthase complex subunit 8 n=1 Tax=Kalotermitidae sp. 6 AB-2022a TaxID=2942738 RepID=A0A8X8RGW8_9NEOP|nr:ATP synthase F0 subunit 8 [Kalotermitidae sp. 6 AB-2022a]